MSGLRYPVLSLTAAGLGVALGLGLGAGPVAERSAISNERTTARLSGHVDRLTERVDRLQSSTVADAKVVTSLAASLVAGRLTGRTVLVVATPGARKVDVRRVRAALGASGATVTGVLRLTTVYVDPAQAQSPLEDLALRLVPPGVEFVKGSSPIERVGTVLARATVQRPAQAEEPVATDGTVAPATEEPVAPATEEPVAPEIDQEAAEVIAGLDELDAVRLAGDPGLLADLAVVVSGPSDADPRAAEPALTGLLAALDAGSLGAVLAGPGDATGGALRWVRDAASRLRVGTTSTVDSLDGHAGAAAVVLALAEQVAGGSGHYGLGRGAGGVVPAVGAGG